MTKIQYLFAFIFIVFLGVAIKGYSLYQAISPNPISYWDTSNESNNEKINHALWADILSLYLIDNPETLARDFAYSQVSPSDKRKLESYLKQLQQIDPRQYSKNEQLAYWVNLYNALTINLVLEHYPIESIKSIGDGFTGPWNQELITITGVKVSLNQIEHGILRALWQEKRIHYVINCASVGCPDLPPTPFKSSDINKQLDKAATRFVNQVKGVNLSENMLRLSSIYNWFSDDFGENTQAIITHISDYANAPLKAQLKQFSGDIEYQYNWKLNKTLSGRLNKPNTNKSH